jgi:hypothetical protein
MVFAPVVRDGESSLTMIGKLGKLMTKFHAIRKTAIKTTVDDFIYDNLYAIQNTIQFYDGISCYSRKLAEHGGDKPTDVDYDFNYRFKTPKSVLTPDY